MIWVQWLMPVVPATQKSEVGGSLEPEELEVSVSYDCSTVLQPGQQSEILSPKQKPKKNKQQQQQKPQKTTCLIIKKMTGLIIEKTAYTFKS